MEKLTFAPSPHIEGKFKVVKTTFPILHSKIGRLDFRDITLEQAEALVAAGTIYLVRVNPTVPRKKKAGS